MRHTLLPFLTAFFLLPIACEHTPSRSQQIQSQLADAVQRQASIDERIMEWGAPNGKDILSDGKIVYTWKTPWTKGHINYGVPGGQAYTKQHFCTVVITTSPQSIIQKYNFNDC